MKLEEIEKDLKKLKPIRFKKDYKATSLKNVIEDALRNDSDTICGLSTYHLNNKLQCEGSDNYKSHVRLRGIADLYRLARNYYPNTKLKEVVNLLKNRQRQYCTTTHQTVYYRNPLGNNEPYYPKEIEVRLSNKRKVKIEDI